MRDDALGAPLPGVGPERDMALRESCRRSVHFGEPLSEEPAFGDLSNFCAVPFQVGFQREVFPVAQRIRFG